MDIVVNIAAITAETVSLFLLYNNFMTWKKPGKLIRIIANTAFFAIMFSAYILHGAPMFDMCVSTFAVVVATFFYEGDAKVKIFSAVGYLLIGAGSEYITGAIIMLFGKIEAYDLIQMTNEKIIGTVISKIVMIFLIKIICMFFGKKYSKIYNKYWVALLTIPLVNISLMLSIIYFFEKAGANSSVSLTVAIVGLLYSTFMLFYVFDKLIDVFDLQQENILLQDQMKGIDKNLIDSQNDERKIISIRHDIKNHLLMIYSLINSNNNKEAIKYIDNMKIINYSENENVKTNNLSLDTILNIKISQAKNKNINTVLNVKKIPYNLKIDSYDICVLFGNLFDNAIEANLKLKENERKISMYMAYEENKLIITMENKIRGTVKFKNGMPITTKIDSASHGIGTKNIHNIINKYHGMIEMKCIKDTFVSYIVLFDV